MSSPRPGEPQPRTSQPEAHEASAREAGAPGAGAEIGAGPDSARASRGPISRGPRARDRMLTAAREVLTDRGLPGLTMEAVARQAGASKATLYRHWSSAADLLNAAMVHAFEPLPAPDTGCVRTDLAEMLRTFSVFLTDTPFPRLITAFLDAADRDPELADTYAGLTQRRRDPVRQILDRACRRGDIPPDTDVELIVDQLLGPLYYRRFFAHDPVPPDGVDVIIDHVLAALGPASPSADQ